MAKYKKPFDSSKDAILTKSIFFLKNKAKTLEDIYNNSKYILDDTIKISSEDLKLLDSSAKMILGEFLQEFKEMKTVDKIVLEKTINELIKKHKLNFKGIGQPLRIALVGSKYGPGIYDVILSLPKDEVVKRLTRIN